jgi:hypothetical protein
MAVDDNRAWIVGDLQRIFASSSDIAQCTTEILLFVYKLQKYITIITITIKLLNTSLEGRSRSRQDVILLCCCIDW